MHGRGYRIPGADCSKPRRRRREAGRHTLIAVAPTDSLPLLLASASPRRRQLLECAGVRFEVRPADVDESALPGEGPREHALRLAEAKARAVAHAVGASPPRAHPLLLASASPRRRQLLTRAGVRFEVRPAAHDESALPGEAPCDCA
ncbi:MAG TPA: Maf family protein, partial [Myxococcota bacterium]